MMRMWTITRMLVFLGLSAIVVGASVNAETWAAQQIVVPASSRGVEGEPTFADDLPSTPNGGRVQELQLAADFLVLGSGPFQLGGLALRPDKSVLAPYSFNWDIQALNLSTTHATPQTLSAQFEVNRGPDVTTVFSGAMTFETDGSGPPDGPRNFDYVIEFDRPYIYDPAQGNLLVEWVYGADVGNSTHDGWSTSVPQIVVNFDDVAEASGRVLDSVSAMQFSIVPEPSTILLEATSLLSLLFLRRREFSRAFR